MARYKYDERIVEWLKANCKGKYRKEMIALIKQEFDVEISENRLVAIMVKYGLKSGVDASFKKGHTLLKGKKGLHGANKGSFKKGERRTGRYREVGTETVGKDDYIFVKVSDKMCVKKSENWMPKQRYIYEQYHKIKVPNNYRIIFADGNKRNFDINNLIMVSKKEHFVMNRRNLTSSNADVTKSGAMIAKVIVKAKERKKGKKDE